MRTRTFAPLALATMLAMLGVLAMAGAVAAAETVFTLDLEGGDAEVPPGDPDGSGMATITIDPEAGTACWDITVENIEPATASHIHEAPPGTAGPIVVNLDVDGFEGSSEGCTEMVDAATLQGIVDSPADFYVNVHTADYAPGAVRGQLAAAQVPSTAMPSDSGSPLTLLGVLALLAALATGIRAARPAAVR